MPQDEPFRIGEGRLYRLIPGFVEAGPGMLNPAPPAMKTLHGKPDHAGPSSSLPIREPASGKAVPFLGSSRQGHEMR
jgi:hypothetical protein